MSEQEQQQGTGDQHNSEIETNQTGTANISTLANTNKQPATGGEDWRGNPQYFQDGKKAGQKKPAYRTPEENRAIRKGRKYGGIGSAPKEAGGLDTENLGKFAGLRVDDLRATNPQAAPASEPQQEAKTRAQIKAEKKASEAKTGAKLVMRALDLVVGFISGNTYGANFTPEQRAERNEYREQLEKDWADYLETLDIPMHPGLVVAVGSIMYVAPALDTEKGKERTRSWKQKIGGFIGAKVLGG